jgi:hypothetical protein
LALGLRLFSTLGTARVIFANFTPTLKTKVTERLEFFEDLAQFTGDPHPVFLRVASDGGQRIIDLCDESWSAVTVSADGWRVGAAPVRFRRTEGMRSLPQPVPGGSIKELLPFLNLPDDNSRILCLSWLLSALHPTGACPVLSLTGMQGSAKSSLAKILRSLIDPCSNPLRTAALNERDLCISAQNSYMICFDNLSAIPHWLSDAICRLSTGAGMALRKLYTDQKEILFGSIRPVLFNGITVLAERGDLRDRLIDLHLPPISQDARKGEDEFWKAFDAARSRIFGALLDALVLALRNLPTVPTVGLPRMTGFSQLGVAAEKALGFRKGFFLTAYKNNRRESSLTALEYSPAAALIPKLLNGRSSWEGTHGQLLQELNLLAGGDSRDPAWPRSGRKMAAVLAREEPSLLTAGIRMRRLARSGGSGSRRIRLEYLTVRSSHSAGTKK